MYKDLKNSPKTIAAILIGLDNRMTTTEGFFFAVVVFCFY